MRAIADRAAYIRRKTESVLAKHECRFDFTRRPITDEELREAQERLSVALPDQYTQFLKRYGHGGIGRLEIIGVGMTGKLFFVEDTLRYREAGLPNDLVVIENCGEWVYCIDCEAGHVMSWDGSVVREHYADFNSYFLARLRHAVENIQNQGW